MQYLNTSEVWYESGTPCAPRQAFKPYLMSIWKLYIIQLLKLKNQKF